MSCSRCGARYDPLSMPVMCEKDDLGRLDISYDYEKVKETLTKDSLAARPRDVWRWAELLPAEEKFAARLGRRGHPPPRGPIAWGNSSASRNLYLKDETRNPTGSFKDRAMAVSVAKAVEKKVEDRDDGQQRERRRGPLGLRREGGPEVVAFVLDSASDAKVAQLVLFGAKVIKVQGHRTRRGPYGHDDAGGRPPEGLVPVAQLRALQPLPGGGPEDHFFRAGRRSSAGRATTGSWPPPGPAASRPGSGRG